MAVVARTRMPDTDALWLLTAEHAPHGVVLVSPDDDILYVNESFRSMLGYGDEALTQMRGADITHPDDVDLDQSLVHDLLAGRSVSARAAKRFVRADNSVAVAEVTVALMRDALGAPLYLVSQVVDLTERHSFESRLQRAESQVDVERRRAEAVFDAVAVGLLLLDGDGRYLLRNRRHRELLTMAFAHGAGDTEVHVFDAGQTRRLTLEELPETRAAAGEEFQDLLVWVGDRPDDRRALSVSARAVRDRDGVFAGAAMACHDVTDLMRALRVKDDFLASISHELRTPLTSVMAYVELLQSSDGLDETLHKQLGVIHRNSRRLSHLVSDLLFTATAASGTQVMDFRRVDLATVLQEAVQAARPDAEAGEVLLLLDVPESLVMSADGFRLRQVADNLIANAIAYTMPDGTVRVSLARHGDGIEIVVADDGEGIPEAELADVFATFVRGRNARERLVPGTGLGLNIVRTIVEAHGGQVGVESVEGVGTTVRLLLPAVS